MDDSRETPLGVKMLADHLVQVKLQYEEQINDMLVKMRNMEKEKVEMQRQYRLLEEELDTRRREIFVLKQENNVQYMMEERENWKAMIAQQKHMNAKLEKDLEISRERIRSLQHQLENSSVVTLSPEETFSEPLSSSPVVIIADESLGILSEERKSSEEGNTSFESQLVQEELPSSNIAGPPQPLAPPVLNDLQDSSIQSLLEEKERLERELAQIHQELRVARADVMVQLNAAIKLVLTLCHSQLTDQFIRRVDDLEHDHQERENSLLASIEALKLKLDLELEKKWEMMQEMREEEVHQRERGGLMSFLWG